jgi:hypothetical protein
MTGVLETDRLPFQPIVIIGAGRSGTNVLRDCLVRLDGFATWPCDEINPIWRHGNLGHTDDAIPVELATPAVKEFVRNAFIRIWNEQGRPDFVVEKTCANSLRVPFVNSILPEAQFIHIVRDGYDVMASAKKRWGGELEFAGLPYLLAKARYAPKLDLPIYALSALRSRLAVRLGLRQHLKSWGPKFAGMDSFSNAPVDELIARQWAACVNESHQAFANIGAQRVFLTKYEDLVDDAGHVLGRVIAWLGAQTSQAEIVQAAALVRKGSVGKGRRAPAELSECIHKVLQRPLKAFGYLD